MKTLSGELSRQDYVDNEIYEEENEDGGRRGYLNFVVQYVE
jgi:hypothetical protein